MKYNEEMYVAEVTKNDTTYYINRKGELQESIDDNCFHFRLPNLYDLYKGIKDEARGFDKISVVYKKAQVSYSW